MSSFMEKIKGLTHRHEDKVDQAIDKTGEQADQRTGGKYGDQIDKGVDAAKRRTGQGDTRP
ncbi:antitoxin [Dactylosporangium sp. NPDC005555]|uniref:antitoxin n=1 Tax=Dactylosporangium sp. NPDC005555 TaxID=3154889 RepID=UPI0033B228CA